MARAALGRAAAAVLHRYFESAAESRSQRSLSRGAADRNHRRRACKRELERGSK